MKSVKTLLYTLLIPILFISCGEGNSNTKNANNSSITKNETTDSPEVVAEKFYTALTQLNFDEVIKYCTPNTAKAYEETKSLIDQFPADALEMMKKEASKLDFKIEETKVSDNGNSAIIIIKTTNSDTKTENSTPLTLIKINGKWKVDDAPQM